MTTVDGLKFPPSTIISALRDPSSKKKPEKLLPRQPGFPRRVSSVWLLPLGGENKLHITDAI